MSTSYEEIEQANQSIKTADIKGKPYAEVNQRIKAFRMVYPDGFILTEMASNENGVCIFKASVGYTFYDDVCHELIKKVLGTGTAYEKEGSTFINKTSYIENCETSAVGRALGMAGFGIDTSVSSKEEVENAIAQQKLDEFEKAIKDAGKTAEEICAMFKKNELKDFTAEEIDYVMPKLKKGAK